ncbi:MAG TPA: Ldh family oxidoreductase [Brevefilum sp.]|nr:Ldh family oxidoreductase [Brevefilum sp.]HOR18950.1 Ldh family oxidoreductase [Brevefilum sp.]HPL69371.1 Ldh family oxidoreductase [Brevefilum sp.]
MPETLIYPVEALKDYVARFFIALNVPEIDAHIAADVLVSADLRGINSHGVIRLHSYYGDRLMKGAIDPASTIQVIQESPATLALDGGNGLGQVVAYRAMSRCIELAEQAGLSITTVRNSNHYGIAGYYAMMALPEDMIGISLTNSQPLVAPTFGRTAVLGTNPIAVAIPAGTEKPYVLDMATSIVSIGRITVHQKSGQPIPAGWGINAQGELTQAPGEVLQGGALLPLGGPAELRGYKGYGLSLLVDLLSGALSGAAYGNHVGHPGKNSTADVGHFFAAIKIENFRPVDEFKADMDDYIRMLKATPKIPGQDRIYIHGEKEFENEENYREHGVPLLSEIVESLISAGQAVGVPFDLEAL